MRAILLTLLLALAPAAMAQEASPAPTEVEAETEFDTSYTPSAAVTYRVKRSFLDGVYRSAGADARAAFRERFDEKSHELIWQDLVEPYGMRIGNVADALAAYWMLNWMVANAAFTVDVPPGPVRRQLHQALSVDRSFRALNDDQRQVMAERLMLDFLVLHAAMSTALRNQDVATLQGLAREAVVTFRRQYGVDLLALEPGADGLAPRSNVPPASEPEAQPEPEASPAE
ncbi:DUF6683 family protein [Devosia albogilva]|uniref:DUF6683 family protein n=1 Tax=Devosia albogilva TaxID=429726 RepID=A0ABW5QN74_9HYPH